MTKADLVDQVTALGDLTRRDGEVIVDTLFESIISALKANDKVGGPRLWELPHATAQFAHRTKSEDRSGSCGSRETGSLLQAEQGVAGPGESGRSRARTNKGDDGESRSASSATDVIPDNVHSAQHECDCGARPQPKLQWLHGC